MVFSHYFCITIIITLFMRKSVFSFGLLIALACSSATASPVSQATARRVAETWLQAMGMRDVKSLVDVTSETPFTEFYVFAAPAGGFILVSGDDCAIPVLGYSIDEHFKTKDMPSNVLSFLSGYDEEIKRGKENKLLVADTIVRQWELLTKGQMPKAAFDNSVLPLLTTCWDQAPYYNELCPLDNEGNHFMTGCVATAMAQIMKYWNYPTTGYGSHSYNHFTGTQSADFGATTYDWAHMPYRLTALSSPEEVEAVATLMYHAGVAVDMGYNYGGSGATPTEAKNSMVKYFKYSPNIRYVTSNGYSDSALCAILRDELDQGHPIYTGAYTPSDGAHAFVCDGYSIHNYFHFNLGWGGGGNGYYTLWAINADAMKFYQAIIGIQPNNDWDTAGTTSITTSVTGGFATVTGAGTYSFGNTVTLSVDSVQDGFYFSRWSDECRENPREIYTTGGTYHFTAVLDTIPQLIINDTLSYCGNNCHMKSAYSLTDSKRWGVRFSHDVFPYGDTLTAVQIFTFYSGEYILEVYVDSTLDIPAYSDTSHFANEGLYEAQWHTLPLSTPVVIDSSQDLWITFRSNVEYPATYSQYNIDTYNQSLSGTNLQHYTPGVAWMIRGILHPLDTMPDTTAADVCEGLFPVPYFIGGDSATFTSHAACWRSLDADEDGNGWEVTPTSFYSYSWDDNMVLTPDNWLRSPAFVLHDDLPCVLGWTTALNPRYPHEHYGVYLSHTGDDTSSYVLLGEYDCDTTDDQRPFSLPLDDWMGDTIHIIFRHFNSTDQNFLCLHSINIRPSPDHQVDVYSNNSSWGRATGSGSYAHGSSVIVEATPFEGSTFEGWSDNAGQSVLTTDNPYTFTLMDNTTLMAVFHNSNDIEEAEDEDIIIFVRDKHIIVEGAEGETVQVFNTLGHLLKTFKQSSSQALHSGVFLVKVGNRPVRKVVVL